MPLLASAAMSSCCKPAVSGPSVGNRFPHFLPPEVEFIRDPYAREMARRIERLPVQTSLLKNAIMSSCVKPMQRMEKSPVVLLHSFDSSCLEWRYTFPLLESGGLESWAIDILGWGFSDLEALPSCNVSAKREHLYQFWKAYVKRPMILVGPSLGAAVAVDFAVHHSEAVSKLILVDASVYAEGTGNLAKLPKVIAYAGAFVLKSIPLRFYANTLSYKNTSIETNIDRVNIGRLHCLLPWWVDATIDFMLSGGYNVGGQLKKINQETLIIWGMDDNIIESSFSQKLRDDLPCSFLHQIPECGHLPHVDKPNIVAKLIIDFVSNSCSSIEPQQVAI